MAELRGGTTIGGYEALHTGNGTVLLETLKTVDGPGSGLEADILDGKQASDFASVNHTHGITEVDGLEASDTVTINGVMITVGAYSPFRAMPNDVWVYDINLPNPVQETRPGLAMIDAETINGIRVTISSAEPTEKDARDLWMAI